MPVTTIFRTADLKLSLYRYASLIFALLYMSSTLSSPVQDDSGAVEIPALTRAFLEEDFATVDSRLEGWLNELTKVGRQGRQCTPMLATMRNVMPSL